MSRVLAHCGRMAECAVAVLQAEWKIKRRPFAETAQQVCRPIASAPAPLSNPSRVALDVRGALGSVCKRLPWKPTCLVKALAAQAVLRWRNIPSTVVLSIAPGEGSVVDAHAWLEAAGVVVTGRTEMQKFLPIHRLSNAPPAQSRTEEASLCSR